MSDYWRCHMCGGELESLDGIDWPRAHKEAECVKHLIDRIEHAEMLLFQLEDDVKKYEIRRLHPNVP